MKAEEAKKIADEAIKLLDEAELKELEPLFISIREAAATGKTSINVDLLSNIARKQLNKNGFTIRFSGQNNETYCIDWSNPNSVNS
ncbi:hypothetical protein AHMF7605_23750 [Adhaeribacter arboris]|uniref:Uncharacterized protein n=1 Tax=Adhaeribacter arboris TaxID=2072846 RepID=A0A2T2YLA2_9BACT|nr:hypothetical protein [Adhaeribacter arboris]PSR56296.1 hypothetical protein AHMF7605_23750 [Adhaeribacter arboris]